MQELDKILEEIEQAKREPWYRLSNYDVKHKLDGAINRIIDIIRKHINDGWIPVEKALPPEPPEYVDDEDDLEQYIVMIDGAERPTTLRYAGDGNWWEDGTYYHVIAWRPMPEVYRQEGSEGE